MNCRRKRTEWKENETVIVSTWRVKRVEKGARQGKQRIGETSRMLHRLAPLHFAILPWGTMFNYNAIGVNNYFSEARAQRCVSSHQIGSRKLFYFFSFSRSLARKHPVSSLALPLFPYFCMPLSIHFELRYCPGFLNCNVHIFRSVRLLFFSEFYYSFFNFCFMHRCSLRVHLFL